MDLFLIAAWCIWTERNDFIFSNHVPSTAAWKARFISEVRLHLCRYPPNCQNVIVLWLESLY
jgi:hypothetical protein